MAKRTPASRNRYVDFLRALAILAVVVGHWLISAPCFSDGVPAYSHLLDLAPWTRWLTWLFQVMPVFFFVGGFSNGVSWSSAERRGLGYAAWLDCRLRRLLGPVLPLLLTWGVMVAVAHSNGVSPAMIEVGSQVALVPVWFLAVYILVVTLVPLTFSAWRRWGYASCIVPVVAAAAVDVAFFAGDQRALGWLNYPLIWVTVHQLGYAWRERRLVGVRTGAVWLGVALGALVVLTHVGPYPLSLVGVPSDEVSNTLPPKLPLLALGMAQIGLLLMLEAPMRRWLERPALWAGTILVNGMIMTIYLWHSTVMMLLVGLAFWHVPVVLDVDPAGAIWWWTRPLWLLAYAVASVPFVLAFSVFERPRRASRPAAVWRQLLGGAVACCGLALLALDGVGSARGWLGLRWLALLLPLAGCAVAGIGFHWRGAKVDG
jgi:fucose 4-O-acetylase-like acetyltransferase